MSTFLHKKEFVIVALIAAVCAVWILVLRRPKHHVTVQVVHGQEVVREFSPEEDALYHIDGDCGGLDVEVKGGRWHVINEQCPNHICAHTGWASPEDMIVITCMPNDIVIQVSEYTYETR